MRRALVGLLAAATGIAVACSDFDADGPQALADGGSDAAAVVESGAGPIDASVIDADVVDADDGSTPAIDAGNCDPSMPFVHYRPVSFIVNTAIAEQHPRLSPDELTMFVTKNNGAGNAWIQVFTRTTFDADWVAGPILYDTATPRQAAWVSADLNRIYFEQYVAVTTPYYRLERAIRADGGTIGYGPAVGIPSTQLGGATTVEPYLSPDEQTIYFASPRTTGNYNIFTAAADGDGGFTTPTNFTIDTTRNERSPVISADGLTLYFASDSGRATVNNYALRMATRAHVTDDFTTAIPIPGLGDLDDESKGFTASPGWISPDNCRLYVMTTFNKNFDVYLAWRR